MSLPFSAGGENRSDITRTRNTVSESVPFMTWERVYLKSTVLKLPAGHAVMTEEK